jgi:hypothetical protein
MAIGSSPEIGAKFTTWGKMDEASRVAWFKFMKEHWGPTLLGGYGKLITNSQQTKEQNMSMGITGSGICVFPTCETPQEKDIWCREHYGYFPHKCKEDICERRPLFDDEPFCFEHSPDEGSSVKGYSAYREALGI